jgi:hypothetical protein
MICRSGLPRISCYMFCLCCGVKHTAHSRQAAPTVRAVMRKLLCLLVLPCAFFSNAETLKNHYNDPFIQVTNGVKNCPQPRGPFMTIAEANAEAHPRIERGTTCFMSGKCTEPNAYRYDAQIGAAAKLTFKVAVGKEPSVARSSVWLTVQRRFVFAHGCVSSKAQVTYIEALLKSVPDVEYVGADFIVGDPKKAKRMPYPTMLKLRLN